MSLFRKKNSDSGSHIKAILEEENRKKLQNKLITYRRMIALIVLISICITGLFIRVYYLTVNQHTFYQSKLLIYQTKTYTSSVPRGSIYDRNGVELVSTKANLTIMYFPTEGITDDQELEMAYEFIQVVDVDISDLSSRDKKDYYILKFPDEASKLITDEEWDAYYNGDLKDNEIYYLKLERITDEMLEKAWNDEDLKAFHIYYLMNKNASDPGTIVEDVSEQQASYIAEHSDVFKGFYVSYTYDRVYNYGTIFKQVFGKVSTSTQGIPQEESETLLALGYQMTSTVGTSGLEEEYEDLLSGTPNEYTIEYDDDGNAITNDVVSGQKGYNLTLTIDWNLEEYLNSRIEDNLNRLGKRGLNKNFDRMFITMIDPNTGEILAMAGKILNDDGTFTDYAAGNYLEAFACGSSVKGATLYTGFKYGVVSPGEYMWDTPIRIKDTPEKASWEYLGYINDLDAIAMSSNVYMMQIVIRLGGGNYVEGAPLNLNLDTFKKLKETFGELGLGVMTGLDVPDEQIGSKGDQVVAGLLLDYAIGQYDTYTTVQLAQYISTIANGGKRIRPYLVKDAWYNDNGDKVVVYENEIEVLDDNTENESYFARIRQAMIGTVSYGTVHGAIDANIKAAGKTGTAEVYDENGDTFDNRIFVGFAPYDNPRIAYACIAPWQETVDGVSSCITIANEAFAYYNVLYPEQN